MRNRIIRGTNAFAFWCVCVCINSWVFIHEKAYQVRDTGIESAVMTKVKGFGLFNNNLMDVADYVMPTQVSNARSLQNVLQ